MCREWPLVNLCRLRQFDLHKVKGKPYSPTLSNPNLTFTERNSSCRRIRPLWFLLCSRQYLPSSCKLHAPVENFRHNGNLVRISPWLPSVLAVVVSVSWIVLIEISDSAIIQKSSSGARALVIFDVSTGRYYINEFIYDLKRVGGKEGDSKRNRGELKYNEAKTVLFPSTNSYNWVR